MQNAACSSSICEPRTPAPAASASIKPAKMDCCFSEMCWGELPERAHSFSARGKQKALGTAGFMLKPANIPSHWGFFGLEPRWEHLAGAFLGGKLSCSVSLQVPVARKYCWDAVAPRFFWRGSSLTWHWHSHDLLQPLALGISNSGCFGPLIPGDLKFFTAEKPCGQWIPF